MVDYDDPNSAADDGP